MPAFVDFLQALCTNGDARLHARPLVTERDRADAQNFLNQLHEESLLHIAGPTLELQPVVAVAAAELIWNACWYLLNHDEPAERVEAAITMKCAPSSPAAHLSADLMLRYAAQLHRRSCARSVQDILTTRLQAILREWPLSGVQSSVAEAPSTAPDFDDHSGIRMLYAERWSENPKPLWRGEKLTAETCTWFEREKAHA